MIPDMISLELIDLEAAIWPRDRLDQGRIAEFRRLYEDGGPNSLPAIEIVVTGDGRYLVADGVTRLLAWEETGATEIPCVVLTPPAGERPDLFAFKRALETASTAAKPLTPKERKRNAQKVVSDMPELSDRQVAALVGVSHQSIGRWKVEWSNVPAETGAGEDPIVFPDSADDIARKLAMAVGRLWEGRGLSDALLGDRTGKRLARALANRYGDDALAWARRLESWAAAAASELQQ